MKKLLFLLMALSLVSGIAFAADSQAASPAAEQDATATASVPAATPKETPAVAPIATPAAAQEAVLKGVVIDNTCAGANKANLADFVKTHTKQCALMPGCMESGYSLYADGKLYAFDKDSSAKVAEFLKKADSKLDVTVTAKQVGDVLTLVSIENQK